MHRTTVAPGERVLVFGAAGGLGLAVLQVAKALGATTIGVVSTEAKAEVARQAGADETIVGYDDVESAVRAIAPDGIDLVADPVGGEAIGGRRSACCAGDGRFVVLGFAGGEIPKLGAQPDHVRQHRRRRRRLRGLCRERHDTAQAVARASTSWSLPATRIRSSIVALPLERSAMRCAGSRTARCRARSCSSCAEPAARLERRGVRRPRLPTSSASNGWIARPSASIAAVCVGSTWANTAGPLIGLLGASSRPDAVSERPAEARELLQGDARAQVVEQLERRDHLLERGVAGPVAQPVDGDVDPVRAGHHPGDACWRRRARSRCGNGRRPPAPVASRARPTSRATSSGVATPTESATYTRPAPAAAAARHRSARNAGSARVQSLGMNATSAPASTARPIAAPVRRSTSGRLVPSTRCRRSDERATTLTIVGAAGHARVDLGLPVGHEGQGDRLDARPGQTASDGGHRSGVLGEASGIADLHRRHAGGVEPAGELDLRVEVEPDPLALLALPQGDVVDLDGRGRPPGRPQLGQRVDRADGIAGHGYETVNPPSTISS